MNDMQGSPGRYALIYGLSANPVHQGHIALLIGTLTNLRSLGYAMTQTLIIPVYRRNPTGDQKDVLPETFEHRFKMCEFAAQEVLAALPDTPISVSRVEKQLAMGNDRPNYTADTLTYLKNHALSKHELIFVSSSQIFSGIDPEFSHWYQTGIILKTAILAVCPRPGFPPNQDYLASLSADGGRFILLDNVKTPDISSTMLRQRLQKGESPLALAQAGFLPYSIAHYLDMHNDYQNGEIRFKKSAFHHGLPE